MKKTLTLVFHISLLLLISLGIFLRFYRYDWSQGANLHPDEYGLTNTLTQLSVPKTLSDYFNTRLSPLSPYSKYALNGQHLIDGADNGMRWGQWPMTIIRFAAEQAHQTGYDELRLLGRQLSALADVFSLLLIFLIGRRLYNATVGLLAAALSALAVLQIQQSHFMTVDNFAVVFAMLAMYACVGIAQCRPLWRPESLPERGPLPDRLVWTAAAWYLLFGIAFGMALASKINLLPLGGMLLVAGFLSIADLRLRSRADLLRILLAWAGLSLLALLAAALTFRITQPFSFRQPVGDTTFLSLHLNPDWVDNMKRASVESNGIGGGPPGDQWAHRIAILFPWVNMVMWGLGLPLGLMSWAAFLWAAGRLVWKGDNWRAHLLPLIWVGGYFGFMATRWVKSIRYFLPIYPFLALFAAWGLIELWKRFRYIASNAPDPSRRPSSRKTLPAILAVVAMTAVLGGTLAWALAFTQAVYATDHTRIQATRWIFDNLPGPFQIALQEPGGALHYVSIVAPDALYISNGYAYVQPFSPAVDGSLAAVFLPHLTLVDGSGLLHIQIASDALGQVVLDEATVPAVATSFPGQPAQASFRHAGLVKGATYYLIASVTGNSMVNVSRAVLSNENWDEGLPFPFEGLDPFGQLYRGVTMEVRWYDNEDKRQMFITTLGQADYLILPSQRSLWTTCRIPRSYPMTMDYYRALFGGQLGFDLVGSFSAPLKLGPLEISDLGGTFAWGGRPSLPMFNHSLLAAEEAFSVYDHPPVWIFKKRPDYSQAAVQQFFDSIDLSQVVVQSPRNATPPACPGNETIP